MTKKSLKERIDRGGVLAEEIKEREDELEAIKKELKAEAAKAKRKNHRGGEFFMQVSPTSGSDCDAGELHTIMQSLEMDDRAFYDLVKVKTGEAKTMIGEAHMGPISQSWSKPYNSVKFKRLTDIKKEVDFTI